MRALTRSAAAALVVLSLIGAAAPVRAGEACLPSETIQHARDLSKDKLAAHEWSSFVEMTGAEMAAFVKAANEQFHVDLPADGVDAILAIGVNDRVAVFTFAGGCEVGFVALPSMPRQVTAPALLDHGLRLI